MTLLSMTGFGRASVKTSCGPLIAEMVSVNRRYLEMVIHLPESFSRFEFDVRKWVGEVLSRGQLTVRVFLISDERVWEGLSSHLKDLQKWQTALRNLAEKLGYDPSVVDFPLLLDRFATVQKQEFAQDRDLSSLRRCVKKALQNLLVMMKKEGALLAKDIRARLKKMQSETLTLEKLAPLASQKMHQKLLEKMEELQKSREMEDRVIREVALFAEKVDISEEIVRLRSHLEQFLDLLDNPKEQTIGKKMDFLAQEMGREINTLGSKSLDVKISQLVIELKSELEKIREQIQNIA